MVSGAIERGDRVDLRQQTRGIQQVIGVDGESRRTRAQRSRTTRVAASDGENGGRISRVHDGASGTDQPPRGREIFPALHLHRPCVVYTVSTVPA